MQWQNNNQNQIITKIKMDKQLSFNKTENHFRHFEIIDHNR